MNRIARCHCGQLTLNCEGEPAFVVMCHCGLCQRRTGSSYNLGAWFERTRINIKGQQLHYTRCGEKGIEITYYFCPGCGSNVYWESPGYTTQMLGVAVGCFADPDFPPPNLSLYGKYKHCWLELPKGINAHAEDLEE